LFRDKFKLKTSHLIYNLFSKSKTEYMTEILEERSMNRSSLFNFPRTQSINTNDSSSSVGHDHNSSHCGPSSVNNHNHETEEEHYSAHDPNLILPNLKNPFDLNQVEIICALALELMKDLQSVINPLTRQPFRMKFGESFVIETSHIICTNRFSLGSNCWWDRWKSQLSVLPLRRHHRNGKFITRRRSRDGWRPNATFFFAGQSSNNVQ